MFRFMDQYGEMEEGALDADDIEGTLDEAGERMQQLIRDTQYSINLLKPVLLIGSGMDPDPGRRKLTYEKYGKYGSLETYIYS
jgi:hypothetical protein